MRTSLSDWQHPASGKWLARPLLQPHVESWKDCFDAWEPFPLMRPGKIPPHAFGGRELSAPSLADTLWRIVTDQRKQKLVTVQVGPFCSVRRDDGSSAWYDVSCADWVLSRIYESGAVIPNQPFSFEVISHNNGWSVVIAKQGGYAGLWLAYIRTETIPTK